MFLGKPLCKGFVDALQLLQFNSKEGFCLSLRKKLLITIFACIMITGLSAMLGFHFVLQRYARSLYSQSANLNQLYSSVLSGELSRLISSGGTIATDPSVQSLLLQEKAGGSALDEAKHFLGQSVDNRITGIFLYDSQESRIALGNTGVSNEILSGLARRVLDETEQCWIPAGTRDGSVLMGRRVLSSQPGSFMQPIGVLILRININRVLLPQTGSPVQWNRNCYIALYHDGSPVYPAENSEQPPVLPDIGDGEYQILSLNGREYFVTMSTLEEGGNAWQLVLGLPYGETVSQIALSRRMVFVFIMATSLLAFALTAVVMHRFTQNYTLLVSKMDRFKRGEYKPQITEYRNTGDELVSLNRTFDEMAVSYERMTRENYEKQLLLMQARLKNLENQLDPHFLFNTLETISYFAKRSGEDHIPQVVTSLAELLQYSLRGKGDCVPLQREKEILEKYLYIQKLRFSDILSVSFDFDERTLSAMIPKMTLQPLD